MKYKYFKASVIIALGFTACNNKDTSVILVDTPAPSVTVSHRDDIVAMNLKNVIVNEDFMLSVIDSIEIINIESNDESIIGKIKSVNNLNGRLVVTDAMSPGKICVFNQDGNFEHTIGSKGSGPEEYAVINNVTCHGDTIQILDWQTNRLISYHVNGDFINTIDLTVTQPDNLYCLDNGNFIGTYTGYLKRNPFEIRWISSSDSVMGTALPFKYTRPRTAGKVVQPKNGEYLYYSVMSDTIYRITSDSIIPRITFGLYVKNEVDDWMRKTVSLNKSEYARAIYNPSSDDCIVNMIDMLILDDLWLVHFQDSRYAYLSVVNPRTYKAVTYIRSDVRKQFCYFPFVIVGVDGNSIYSYIDESLLSMSTEENMDYLRKCMEKIPGDNLPSDIDFDNSNPIIVRFTLKNRL